MRALKYAVYHAAIEKFELMLLGGDQSSQTETNIESFDSYTFNRVNQSSNYSYNRIEIDILMVCAES